MTDPDRPRTVGLVACGASKLDHRAPARQLYTGNLFRAASAHAEATCDAWWILSAKYRLVRPDDLIEPYNLRLDTLRRDDLRQWVILTETAVRLDPLPDGETLGALSMRGVPVTVRFFAGATYRRPLMDWWERTGVADLWTIEAPLAGLGIGEQLQWYKRAAS